MRAPLTSPVWSMRWVWWARQLAHTHTYDCSLHIALLKHHCAVVLVQAVVSSVDGNAHTFVGFAITQSSYT